MNRYRLNSLKTIYQCLFDAIEKIINVKKSSGKQ
jgi:hypothetical protein